MDPVPKQRQDDFDMAKLQKALKQQQQRSSTSRNRQAAKLTPAEIRSLGHSAVASKAGSIRSVDARSLHRLSSSTPPLTPDNQPLQNTRAELKPSSNLPTPPSSPQCDRRDSSSSGRKIHAPKPISPHVAAASLNGRSRPSSVKSYRGIATYRGPELTRRVSLTMLQHPSQQIVSNPLSNFSRPRQSTLTSSPDKLRADQQTAEAAFSSVSQDESSRSLVDGNGSARPEDSPLLLDKKITPKTATINQNEIANAVPTEARDDEAPSSASPQEDLQERPAARPRASWRKSTTSVPETDKDQVKLRKESKRRTLTFHRQDCIYAIQYTDTKPGPLPQLKDSLKTDLPSAKTNTAIDDAKPGNLGDIDFDQHPAVRPLNKAESSVDEVEVVDKGKAPEADSDTSSISSYPSYSRCSCCGRLTKPGGFMSELSPVLENENLRTNFSLASGRTSIPGHGRVASWSSDNSHRYTPIIPMEIGNAVRQAGIAPRTEPLALNTTMRKPRGVAINKPGDIIGPSSTPLAIMPRTKMDPKMVRFASLHVKADDPKLSEQRSRTQQAEQAVPPVPLQRFGSLYGLRAHMTENGRPDSAAEVPGNAVLKPESQNTDQPSPNAALKVTNNGDDNNTPTSSRPASEDEGDASQMQNTLVSQTPVSSTTKRVLVKEEDIETDGMVVDLSSFDGTFVHGSLSRSATTYAHSESPPKALTNSTSVAAWPSPEPNRGASGDSNNDMLEAAKNSLTQQPQPSIPKKASATQRPTTVVRLVPSETLSSLSSSIQSSPGSSIYQAKTGNTPLKLGDWILPESPSSNSKPESTASSAQEPKLPDPKVVERRLSAYEAQRNRTSGNAGQFVRGKSGSVREVNVLNGNPNEHSRAHPATAAT